MAKEHEAAKDDETVRAEPVVNKAVLKKVAARATKASAKLENRSVPEGYVRSAGVKRLLAERQTRKR